MGLHQRGRRPIIIHVRTSTLYLSRSSSCGVDVFGVGLNVDVVERLKNLVVGGSDTAVGKPQMTRLIDALT